jgi:hypothetical protein
MKNILYVIGGFIGGFVGAIIMDYMWKPNCGDCRKQALRDITGPRCGTDDDCCKPESGCCEPNDGCCAEQKLCCEKQVSDEKLETKVETKTVKGKKAKVKA